MPFQEGNEERDGSLFGNPQAPLFSCYSPFFPFLISSFIKLYHILLYVSFLIFLGLLVFLLLWSIAFLAMCSEWRKKKKKLPVVFVRGILGKCNSASVPPKTPEDVAGAL